MTPEEKKKLQEIFRLKYADLDGRENSWDELIESLGIGRLSKIVHLCVEPNEDEVRIEEPKTGRYLRIPVETARKILVLGL